MSSEVNEAKGGGDFCLDLSKMFEKLLYKMQLRKNKDFVVFLKDFIYFILERESE